MVLRCLVPDNTNCAYFYKLGIKSSGFISCNSTSLCILPEWLCDGSNDCGDYTDELKCPGNCKRKKMYFFEKYIPIFLFLFVFLIVLQNVYYSVSTGLFITEINITLNAGFFTDTVCFIRLYKLLLYFSEEICNV